MSTASFPGSAGESPLSYALAMRATPSGRPLQGEFASYAAADIELVQGDDAVEVLMEQGRTVLAFLTSLPDFRVEGLTYAPGKWTLKEVVGHLIDDERIFGYRALCLARCEPMALPGFDENAYVASTRFEARPLSELTGEYRVVRGATIAFFASLDSQEWLRQGVVNGYTASVRGLAFHLAGHELHHLRVLTANYLPALP